MHTTYLILYLAYRGFVHTGGAAWPSIVPFTIPMSQ